MAGRAGRVRAGPAPAPIPTVHPGRVHHLHVDGVRVHAASWRAASSNGIAPAHRVLLVHGLGANTISWEPVGQPLADTLDATVTAVDLVGFGRTRAPARGSSLAANRDLVTGLLEHLGPSVVIGNSMGGSIAIGVAARRPDLVSHLVLVNPALPHPRPGVSDVLRLARFAPVMVSSLGRHVVGTRARMLGPERLVDASLAWSLHDPARLDPALRTRLVALAAERYAYPEAPGAYAEAARTLLRYLARGLHADLGAARGVPTLLVHGEHDRLVSVLAARDAAVRHAQVELTVLDSVGHAPQLEDPGLLVAILAEWLGARMAGCQSRHPAPGSSTSRSGRSSPT